MRSRTDDMAPADQRLLEDVEVHGVHIVHVPEESGGPGFTFSVGLWENFDQPEVIVFGLPQEIAHELVNLIADEANEGQQFLAGTRQEGLLEGYPVRFVDVPRACYADYLGAACWAYEGDAFPAVQLVWPDKQGRWPWDPEARQGFRASQPVLMPREASG
jgi:hypothetical protein